MRTRTAPERGAASVEHAALVLVMSLAACATVALLAGGGPLEDRSLATALAQKQRCAVRYPEPCWQDALTDAYGRGLAGAVRALAPAPEARAGPGGVGLVGVDYRRCRQPSCATPSGDGLHLTASNRRTTAFVAVREGAGAVGIDYWTYRPTIGWDLVQKTLPRAAIASYAGVPLPESADPVLVPLETLLGRDDARFPPGEEPPWRGRVESRWGE